MQNNNDNNNRHLLGNNRGGGGVIIRSIEININSQTEWMQERVILFA